MELNVKFQEKYKQLDQLCKDCYHSLDGVTNYINEMEKVLPRLSRVVPNSQYDYKQLKHMRWVRNQLAHEVGAFGTDLCTDSDIAWLDAFYRAMLSGNDPLALLRKNENVANGSRPSALSRAEGYTATVRGQNPYAQRSNGMQVPRQSKSNVASRTPAHAEKKYKEDKPSLWRRIKNWFKSWLE